MIMRLFLSFVVTIISLESIALDETSVEKNCEVEYQEICQVKLGKQKTQGCTEIMVDKLSIQCKQLLDTTARLNSFSSFGGFRNPVPADKKTNKSDVEN